MKKEEFLNAVLKTANIRGGDVYFHGGECFFHDPYAQLLLKSLKENCVYDKYSEREYVIKEGTPIRMTNLLSSARLTYLYYLNHKKELEKDADAELEAELPIYFPDGKKNAFAHPDMLLRNKKTSDMAFYEFKCQEPFFVHQPLCERYLPLLKEEFHIDVSEDDIVGEETKRVHLRKEHFGIHDPCFPSLISQWKFDVKQMMTHLLGISNVNSDAKTELVFAFFTPFDLPTIHEHEIQYEFHQIVSSKPIQFYLSKHRNVSLKIRFIAISTFDDPIYEEMKKDS